LKQAAMASTFFCRTPQNVEPPTLVRQHSGIGEAYSVIRSSGSNTTTTRYHDEPEVDYDEGPTELYHRIEAKQWDAAMQRLESHPFEAKTWVYRREHGSEKVRWRLLPIHATCIFRSPLALIEALIEANYEGARMKDDQGMLPIHLACRNGASKGVVLTLLKAFPDSHSVKDRKGRTPLELVESSSSQNVETVSAAIRNFQQQSGLAVAPRTPVGVPAETVAETSAQEVDYENRTILFRLLLKKDWKAAAARAQSNPAEAATWIVTKGFNGNLRFLPLHKACVLQPPANVIQSLLSAYPEGSQCKDQDGWLPIHCACFYGADDRVIDALLRSFSKGGQSKDDEGRLPLHYACLKGASQEVVDVLLSSFPKGAMSKDDEGRLPIHHACSKGAPEAVIDALLKASPKGAQSKDDQGRLPLHHACRKSSSERIIRTLLRVYPRATQIKDDQDKLPIHYACQNGTSPSVINVLLATYPESINIKNGFGYTPLAEARALENPKMDPIIHVLEKFKVEQDTIKLDSGENAVFEAKLDALNRRVIHLERMLGAAMDLGVEIKQSVKKAKDPYTLIDRIADRLSTLDGSSPEMSTDIEMKSSGRMFGRTRK
jgi:ankyrin repeat protein